MVARQAVLPGIIIQRLQRVHRRELQNLRIPQPRNIRRNASRGRNQRLAIDLAHRHEIDPDPFVLADSVVELIDDLLHLIAFESRPFFPVLDMHPRTDPLVLGLGPNTKMASPAAIIIAIRVFDKTRFTICVRHVA